MHSIHEILEIAINRQASDLILKAGSIPSIRINGGLSKLDLPIMTADGIHQFALEVLFSAARDRLIRLPDSDEIGADTERIETEMHALRQGRELNAGFSVGHLVRIRAHLFLEHGAICIALRLLLWRAPTLDMLGLPQVYKRLVQQPRGLIVVSSPAGMGKTTTLAALVNEIDRRGELCVITLEDPVEYLFAECQSIIHQRELGQDTASFASALTSLARQNPDVVVIGDLKDEEHTEAAVRLATRGALVLATLQAGSITDAVSEIIGRFAPATRTACCHMLAESLLAVTTQMLVPCSEHSGRVAATEVLTNSQAVKARLRQGESWDFAPFIREGAEQGMNTMNQALEHLCRSEAISCETAVEFARDPAELTQLLKHTR